MIESCYWRAELRNDLVWLRKKRKYQRWSEKQRVIGDRPRLISQKSENRGLPPIIRFLGLAVSGIYKSANKVLKPLIPFAGTDKAGPLT